MIDIELLVNALREKGHRVEDVISVRKNAGDYEMTVDGHLLNLEEARHLLEHDQEKAAT
jgi:hypothetical protein